MRQNDKDYDRLYKVVLIGDSGAGKTNLLDRLAHSNFCPDSKTTIGVEFETKCFIVDGKRIKVQIWDTAGQERYQAITSAYYRGAQGAIVVYDITRRGTFENATGHWITQLRNSAEDSIIIGLVGNKTDLSSKRAVSHQEAKEAAQAKGFNLTETSALSDVNVNEAFQTLVEQIYRSEFIAPKQTEKSADRSIFSIEDDSSVKSGLWCC
ncbi:Ras-related protein Rab-11A [Nematocida sp. AWRm77]|nr:Ras-related protein Rab-11A [Nematocida sp. AWRm77]